MSFLLKIWHCSRKIKDAQVAVKMITGADRPDSWSVGQVIICSNDRRDRMVNTCQYQKPGNMLGIGCIATAIFWDVGYSGTYNQLRFNAGLSKLRDYRPDFVAILTGKFSKPLELGVARVQANQKWF